MKSISLTLLFTALILLALMAPALHAQVLDTLKIKAEADSLKKQANSQFQTWEIDQSIKTYDDCLSRYRQIKDKAGEGQALSEQGIAYFYKNKFTEALERWDNALKIFQEISYPKGEARTLCNFGNYNRMMGNLDKAIEYHQQDLRISESINDSMGISRAKINLGNVFLDKGEYDLALDNFIISLQIKQDKRDLKGQAMVLNSIGAVYQSKSDYPKALKYIERSIAIEESAGIQKDQAAAYNTLGNIYSDLGDHTKALELYKHSLEISEAHSDDQITAGVLNNLATECVLLSDTTNCAVYRLRSLDLARKIKNPEYESRALTNFGSDYLDKKDYKTALKYSYEGLIIKRKLGDSSSVSHSYIIIGEIYAAQQMYDSALGYLNNALRIATNTLCHYDIEKIQTLIGTCYFDQGLDSSALSHYFRALEQVEDIRSSLAIETQKSSYTASVFDTYAQIILTYLRSIHPSEAFNYAERARARSFLDLLASSQIKVGKPKHEELLQKNRDIAKLETDLEEQTQSADQDTTKVATLRGSLESASNAFMQTLEEKRREEPELASMVSVNPLTLEEVQKLLDKETTLLEYFLTEKKTIYWLVTRRDAQVFQVDVGGDSLKKMVMAFREEIKKGGDTQALSQQLYDILIAPAKDKIGTENLVVVPHGILHYLPFQALQDSQGTYLLDDYRICYLPSASVMKYLIPKRRPKGQKLLALGNPQTDRPGYAPIPYSETEVKDLAGVYPQSKILTEAEATEEQFRILAPQYDILHLACHSDLNAAYPLFSALLLTPDSTQDGELDVHEIFGLDLKAYLVVLSGCETGLGYLTNGDEVVGLSRAFIYAGTPSIMSSLWKVDDESTAYLMTRFYQHLKKHDKAQALRRAQQETRDKYPALLSWASFVLIGDAQ